MAQLLSIGAAPPLPGNIRICMRMVSAAGRGGGETELQQQLVSTGPGVLVPRKRSWALPGAAWGQHTPSFPLRRQERNCRRQLLQQGNREQPPGCTALLFACGPCSPNPSAQHLELGFPCKRHSPRRDGRLGSPKFACRPITPSSSMSEHQQSPQSRAPSLHGRAGSTR